LSSSTARSRCREPKPPLFRRWVKFNVAGLLGVGVQLFALAAFAKHMDYRLAAALAVEAAVLHNFIWHEQMTWRDRTAKARSAVWRRLVLFHAANGLISIIGNVLLMWLFAGALGIPLLFANLMSIVVCSFANFAASEWFVFAPPRVKYPPGDQMFI
jgi:putative flippase GtrA